MTYPTPGQLADYLEQPGRKKARRQFADTSGGPGRCCLGHYADMCGIEYNPTKSHFCEDDFDPNIKGAEWLFEESMRALVPEGLSTVQDALVCANDDEFLVVGNFDQVIKILRSL